MQKNIHPIERAARITIGLVVTSLTFWGPASPWFLFGIVPILTGLIGWCPPYAMLGINTCNLSKIS
jgi:hypothetical protein